MGTYQGEVKVVRGGNKTPDVGSVTRNHITATTAGTFVVATTVADTAINVLGAIVTTTDATRIQFSSAATTITPFFNINETAPLVLPTVPNSGQAYFKTTAGEGLNVEVDGGGLITDTITVSVVTNAE
jgi:hypothetical protein